MDADGPRIDALLDLLGVTPIVALATAFAMLGDAVLGFSPLAPLAGAIVASRTLAGPAGAAASAVLATLCTDFVFLAPRYHWTLNGTALIVAGYYLAVALAAAILNGARRGLA